MSSLFPKPAISEASPVVDSHEAKQFTVRILSANDGNAFRAIRLEALKNEGHLFGPTYEKENAITDTQSWRERCSETKDSCFFGLFDKGNLIGIMGTKKWDKDNTGETALWWSAFLKKEYRGQGLATHLYESREQWTIEHQFKRAVFFILDGNRRSTEIHEKQGAKLMYVEPMEWPDRPIAPWRWYEKRLAS